MLTKHQRRLVVFGIAVVSFSLVGLAQGVARRPAPGSRSSQRNGQESHPLGEQRWSANDLVLMQWTARGWVPTGWTRTFPDRRNRLLYDMYLNNVRIRRADVSVPGWTQTLEYTGTMPGFWWRWPNNDPQAVYILYNNQWWLGTQLVASLQAQAAAPRQPQGGTRYAPVPSCGATPCTQATKDKVTAGITSIFQIQQLYNSMPGSSVP